MRRASLFSDQSGDEHVQIQVDGVVPEVIGHSTERGSQHSLGRSGSDKRERYRRTKRRHSRRSTVKSVQEDLKHPGKSILEEEFDEDLETIKKLNAAFHNDHFQPKLPAIIAIFFMMMTNPLYPIGRALRHLWSWSMGAEKQTDKKEKAVFFDQSMRQALSPISISITVLGNLGLILWLAAGSDRGQVSSFEAWFPRWLMICFALLLGTQPDALDAHSEETIKADARRYGDVRFNSHDCDVEQRDSLVNGFGKPRTQREKELELIMPWSGPVCGRSDDEFFLLGSRLRSIAHESLLRHLERIEGFQTKLEIEISEESSEIRPSISEAIVGTTRSSAMSAKPAEIPMGLERFMSEYVTCAMKGKMPVVVLADQMLVGWPGSQKGALDTVVFGLQVLVHALGVALFVLGALIPIWLRHRGVLPTIEVENAGLFLVVNLFQYFMIFDWIFSCVWPTKLRWLFSEMGNSLQALNLMLMGEHASAEYIPHVRVGNYGDIAGWYELYALLICSTQRQKFRLEIVFAHNLLTVVGLSLLAALSSIDPLWQPDVLFFMTIVHLVAFLLFSLPPLVAGLRVNMLSRRTFGLLWGHVTESRAYLHQLEMKLHEMHEAKAKKRLFQASIDEAKSAIDLTIDIAQRQAQAILHKLGLRLDSALVVRALGVELTLAQFAAIASLASTAVIYAINNRRVIEQNLEALESIRNVSAINVSSS